MLWRGLDYAWARLQYQTCFWKLQGLCHTYVFTGMNPASVTLASALQVKGEALSEEEIWSLLSLAAEQLLEELINCKRTKDMVFSVFIFNTQCLFNSVPTTPLKIKRKVKM